MTDKLSKEPIELDFGYDEAQEIVRNYFLIIDRARFVCDFKPYSTYIGSDPILTFSEDGNAVLEWKDYEPHYDGGSLSTERISFPAKALFLSEEELIAAHNAIITEEDERAERIRLGKETVMRARQEWHDRLEFARLRLKFVPKRKG